MNRQVYEAWRGKDHPWCAWVKPALLSEARSDPGPVVHERDTYRTLAPPWSALDTSWLPTRAAVIVDLPGASALSLGLALGQRGLRPVLSINARSAPAELIPLREVVDLLLHGARYPHSFPEGADVVPALILDARRCGPNGWDAAAPPGCFDNRWAVFESDLPSAHDLLRVHVGKVVVAQSGTRLLADVEDILRAYHAEGIELFVCDVNDPTPLHRVTVGKRGTVADWASRRRLRLSVRRREDGSFGHWGPFRWHFKGEPPDS